MHVAILWCDVEQLVEVVLHQLLQSWRIRWKQHEKLCLFLCNSTSYFSTSHLMLSSAEVQVAVLSMLR